MTAVQLLNTATVRRNIARHQADTTVMQWWERQMRYLAARLNTRVIEVPGRPGVFVPEIFVSLY